MITQEYQILPQENTVNLKRLFEAVLNTLTEQEKEDLEFELDEETSELDKLIKRTANEGNTTIL